MKAAASRLEMDGLRPRDNEQQDCAVTSKELVEKRDHTQQKPEGNRERMEENTAEEVATKRKPHVFGRRG